MCYIIYLFILPSPPTAGVLFGHREVLTASAGTVDTIFRDPVKVECLFLSPPGAWSTKALGLVVSPPGII